MRRRNYSENGSYVKGDLPGRSYRFIYKEGIMLKTDLSGRVAIVTGGSRGIGRATCLMLAEAGANVVVHYRSQADAANEVVAQIEAAGGSAIAVGADMRDPEAPGALVTKTLDRYGKVDILVNNAGEMAAGAVIDLSDELWIKTLNVNLTAVFRCTRACLPAMRAHQWGRIINVTSQAAWTGSANNAHYAASKSGLQGFTFSLVKEEASNGITVNLVAPGRIVTDLIKDSIPRREEEWLKQTPMRRLGQPDEVAAAIVFLASDAASYITGTTIHVNGGLVMS
jgi:3-oxoacyl-[acyl-carrier protein] reductase